MNKKLKLYIIIITSALMLAWWAILFFTNTREQYINYWWQIFMGVAAVLYGLFGVATAAKWNWLKSGVGRGVFFISLGMIIWGIGQFGWSYFLFKDPTTQSPPSHILDIIDFSAIPIWFYGMIELTRATGARYGLKKASGKILIVLVSLSMTILSFYFLVDVARGGTAYFDQPFWKQFFDLGYSIGDAILFTFSLVVFGLSWKFLGGRFRLPIITILISFALLFFADTSYSYLDGKDLYYNGDIADLLFYLMLAVMGLGVTMLDPDHVRGGKTTAREITESNVAVPVSAMTNDTTVPSQPATDTIQSADVTTPVVLVQEQSATPQPNTMGEVASTQPVQTQSPQQAIPATESTEPAAANPSVQEPAIDNQSNRENRQESQ